MCLLTWQAKQAAASAERLQADIQEKHRLLDVHRNNLQSDVNTLFAQWTEQALALQGKDELIGQLTMQAQSLYAVLLLTSMLDEC